MDAQTASAQAGRPIPEWSALAGISRSTYYALPSQYRPRTVKIGKRLVIIESPAEWLERMAKAGGVPCRTARA